MIRQSVVSKTIELMEEKGWHRGRMLVCQETGALTAYAALHESFEYNEVPIAERCEFRRKLNDKLPINLVIYNDRPSTTFEDIKTFLRSMI